MKKSNGKPKPSLRHTYWSKSWGTSIPSSFLQSSMKQDVPKIGIKRILEKSIIHQHKESLPISGILSSSRKKLSINTIYDAKGSKPYKSIDNLGLKVSISTKVLWNA